MFWSLLLFAGHSCGGDSVGKGALGSGQAVNVPGQACGVRGCGPDAFARLGPLSQPPCGLQHPATSCLMHRADSGRVWPHVLRVSTLFSCWCLPESLSCHRRVKKGGWSRCRTLHLHEHISRRVYFKDALGEQAQWLENPSAVSGIKNKGFTRSGCYEVLLDGQHCWRARVGHSWWVGSQKASFCP